MNENPYYRKDQAGRVWARILTEEEVERQLQRMDLTEEDRRVMRKLAQEQRQAGYDESVPVPPFGDFYKPDSDMPAAPELPPECHVEQIEERVVITRGEPKITRTRRRTVPSAARRRLQRSKPPTAAEVQAAVETPEAPQRAKASRKMGRPPLIDDFKRERVCAFLQAGLSRALAAIEIDVSARTLNRTIQNDPEFKQRVLRAEADYEKNRTIGLLQAARDSWRAAAWMFKHYHPHLSTRRWKQRDETEFAARSVKKVREALSDDQQENAA
jgi:hypothetical protein